MTRPTDEQLAAMGATLREIDPSSLAKDDDGSKVHWYLGDNATEFFVWTREGQPPHHVQLVFARVSIEWSTQKGLTTGTFKTSSSSLGGRYDPYLLSIGKQIDREVCRAALLLLQSGTVEARLIEPLVLAIERALAQAPDSGEFANPTPEKS